MLHSSTDTVIAVGLVLCFTVELYNALVLTVGRCNMGVVFTAVAARSGQCCTHV
jgi:hypothetical protein